ncbi:uncharacterized protein LOC117897222 [Drosophila subobscura]|uniref:uncharacterized protein LOC117897222 n=1 Tax=Drosophila subobscura TaxID=7241 RepID=UPI00155AD696|nr:uncharacterized protein LOC117897222 [Drosophila subobscura]
MMLMTHTQLKLSVAIVVGLCLCLGQLQAAAILCGTEAKSLEDSATTTPKPHSEVTKFVHSVQCTLEKAKPWIENIEKEAKLLEEKARDVTRSLLQRITLFVNVLTLPKPERPQRPEESEESDKPEQPEKPEISQMNKDTEKQSSTTEGITSSNEEATTTAAATPANIEWLAEDANEVDNELPHGMNH